VAERVSKLTDEQWRALCILAGDPNTRSRGGLAGWQQKKLAEFIEGHLDEIISLQRLADIAQLSRFHFGRSFKHSFGLPPHRYLMNRRMERAKSLLLERAHSVTEIGLMLGGVRRGTPLHVDDSADGTPANLRRSVQLTEADLGADEEGDHTEMIRRRRLTMGKKKPRRSGAK
jgi:hypothetical protein